MFDPGKQQTWLGRILGLPFGGGGEAPTETPAAEAPVDTSGYNAASTEPAKLFEQVFGSGSPMPSEDVINNNKLDAYLNVTYGIALSLVAAPQGTGMEHGNLLNQDVVTFSSTGAINDSMDEMYGITKLMARTVVMTTSANPELSKLIELKLDFYEPHGLSFQKKLWEVGKGMGYQGALHRFVWRIDIWFSGFDPSSGQWVAKIPFGDFNGASGTEITYFCHMITVEAAINQNGTSYSCTLVPCNYAAFREEVLLTQAVEVEMDIDNVKLSVFFDKLKEILNKTAEIKKTGNLFEIVYPPEIANEMIHTTDSDGSQTTQTSSKKVRINVGRHSSILQIMQTALRSVPTLQKLGCDYKDNTDKPANGPNLTFAIFPKVSYGKATYDAERNEYKNITFTYEIVPFFDWKSAITKDREAAYNTFAKRMMRRVYEYAWSGENTEVISFDAKLKVFFFLNEGFAGLNETAAYGGNQNPQDPKEVQDTRDGKFPKGGGGSPTDTRPGIPVYGNNNRDTTIPYGSPLGKPSEYISGYAYRLPNGAWSDPRDGGRRPHRGIDLGGSVGDPVYATADGVVAHNNGSGGSVTIQHPSGYRSYYTHMSEVIAKKGTVVKKGDLIGRVGRTGNAAGAGIPTHLHYSIYDPKGNAVDVYPYMGQPGVKRHQKFQPGFATPPPAPAGFDPKAPKPPDTAKPPPPPSGQEKPKPPEPKPQETKPAPAAAGGGGSNTQASAPPPTHGIRTQAFTSPNVGIGSPGSLASTVSEAYALSFERRVGPDLIKLEGMQVRGDPRWLLNHEQLDNKKYNWTSSLIRVNVYAPDQSEYMSESTGARQKDLSFGGLYELTAIDHTLEGGRFLQSLTGYRPIGLNPNAPGG